MNEALEAMKMIRPNKKGSGQKSRGEYVLLVSILLIATAFAVIVVFLIYAMVRQRTYWNYIEEFSESTVYAYEHNGLAVTEGEETYLLQGDAVYVPYRLLSGLPFGKTWKDAPEGAESILFEFGDTSTMEVWDTPIENSSMGYTKGLCIRYCNQDGKIYQFDVENVTCDDLKKALR